MAFTNTFIKLVLVLFALYAPLVTILSVFDGFVWGFRFWGNFFAVFRFWMIFPSILRFLIYPNALLT